MILRSSKTRVKCNQGSRIPFRIALCDRAVTSLFKIRSKLTYGCYHCMCIKDEKMILISITWRNGWAVPILITLAALHLSETSLVHQFMQLRFKILKLLNEWSRRIKYDKWYVVKIVTDKGWIHYKLLRNTWCWSVPFLGSEIHYWPQVILPMMALAPSALTGRSSLSRARVIWPGPGRSLAPGAWETRGEWSPVTSGAETRQEHRVTHRRLWCECHALRYKTWSDNLSLQLHHNSSSSSHPHSN